MSNIVSCVCVRGRWGWNSFFLVLRTSLGDVFPLVGLPLSRLVGLSFNQFWNDQISPLVADSRVLVAHSLFLNLHSILKSYLLSLLS